MTKNELHNLITLGEGKNREFKQSVSNDIGKEMCRTMRDVLVDYKQLLYLDTDSQEVLNELREDKGSLLSRGFAPIEDDNKGMVRWTYAGGNINNTLQKSMEEKNE